MFSLFSPTFVLGSYFNFNFSVGLAVFLNVVFVCISLKLMLLGPKSCAIDHFYIYFREISVKIRKLLNFQCIIHKIINRLLQNNFSLCQMSTNECHIVQFYKKSYVDNNSICGLVNFTFMFKATIFLEICSEFLIMIVPYCLCNYIALQVLCFLFYPSPRSLNSFLSMEPQG